MNNRVDSGREPEGMTALEIASVGQRLGAWLVDAVVGILVGAAGLVLGVGFITFLVVIGYAVIYLWMVATKGQSPGKMAVKIKIVRMDGSSLGFGGVLLREIIGKFVSGLVIYLGYIWILFDDKRQGWHDKIAGTYVVKV